MKVTKTCQVCGREYQVKQSYALKSKTCSRTCQHKSFTRTVLLACKRCGTTFSARPCEAGRYVYCSKACRGDLEARFWEKVRKTEGCWLWEGASPGDRGYGTIRVGDDNVGTHRVSWMLHYGPIPEGKIVCHHCDTPECVRPDHLFLGTEQDNIDDRDAKNRQARGETSGMSKLTDESVREIRRLRSIGHTQQDIADRFGVSSVAVSCVLLGKTWKHVSA